MVELAVELVKWSKGEPKAAADAGVCDGETMQRPASARRMLVEQREVHDKPGVSLWKIQACDLAGRGKVGQAIGLESVRPGRG